MLVGQSYFYLASRSPRRRELLNQIGVDHQVLTQRLKSERGKTTETRLLWRN